MAKENLLLRSVSNPPLTTKGSQLTSAELDANWIEIYNALKELSQSSYIDAYDNGVTYVLDDYVMYDSQIWKCVTATVSAVTPGTDATKWQEKYASDLVGKCCNGWKSLNKTLTKAEVLTLNSANGGYGHELLPKPGAGKYYQLRNAVCTFYLDSGGTDGGSLEIYPNSSPSRYIIALGTYFNIGTPSIRLYEPLMIAGTLTTEANNEEVWIYCDTEQVNADGVLNISLEYKLIDPANF